MLVVAFEAHLHVSLDLGDAVVVSSLDGGRLLLASLDCLRGGSVVGQVGNGLGIALTLFFAL